MAILCAFCFTSCVEDYEVPVTENVSDILVVEGNIIANTNCKFHLSTLTKLDASPDYTKTHYVSKAYVMVCGSDGSVLYASNSDANVGDYNVYVGDLNPDVYYWLHIKIGYDSGQSYSSQPMRPLFTEDVTELTYDTKRADGEVDFAISTADPGEERYYRWEYDEVWEINTPYRAEWEYVPATGGFQRVAKLTQRGWDHDYQHPIIVATNKEIGNTAFKKKVLYTINHVDLRLQTYYFTQVRQVAISKEEYEYISILQSQSYDMGGLFTPMPSELPSNINGYNGYKAIGFVGVRGNQTYKQLFVSSGEVGFKSLRHAKELSEEEMEGHSTEYLWQQGYRIYSYNPMLGCKWTYRWCVDATDSSWGNCTLDEPWFWYSLKNNSWGGDLLSF